MMIGRSARSCEATEVLIVTNMHMRSANRKFIAQEVCDDSALLDMMHIRLRELDYFLWATAFTAPLVVTLADAVCATQPYKTPCG
jgi:hypothetical protein